MDEEAEKVFQELENKGLVEYNDIGILVETMLTPKGYEKAYNMWMNFSNEDKLLLGLFVREIFDIRGKPKKG